MTDQSKLCNTCGIWEGDSKTRVRATRRLPEKATASHQQGASSTFTEAFQATVMGVGRAIRARACGRCGDAADGTTTASLQKALGPSSSKGAQCCKRNTSASVRGGGSSAASCEPHKGGGARQSRSSSPERWRRISRARALVSREARGSGFSSAPCWALVP